MELLVFYFGLVSVVLFEISDNLSLINVSKIYIKFVRTVNILQDPLRPSF